MQQTICGEFMLYLLGTFITLFAIYFSFRMKRYYCQINDAYAGGIPKLESCNNNFSPKLNPWFITGFCDAESTFIMSIYKKMTSKTGWQVQPIFAIHIHKKDKVLLSRIQSYFGGVGKWVDHSSDSVMYSVNSVKDIINVIIPHFDKYPLLTQKRADYLLFKSAVLLINDKKHLTLEGLQDIVNIRASMNKGLSEDSPLALEFEINPVKRPKVNLPEEIDPNWIIGFVEGEGCFFIGITKNTKSKINFSVNLLFKISQHKRDIDLLKKILMQLNCGTIQNNTINVAMLQCKKLSDIETKILPLFENYPLQGVKRLDYEDFCKAFYLMKDKAHLTEEGLIKIREIKSRMNFSRNKENISKAASEERDILESNILFFDLNIIRALWISISYILNTAKVKILINCDNPQVTKTFNSWVDTSEAICLLNKNIRYIHTNRGNSDISKKYKEWFNLSSISR